MTSHRGKFPSLSWAWPPQGRHQLLCAALHPNQTAACEALQQWLHRHALDDITFADHRLLGAIIERHGSALEGLPEYPRLLGLRRQLWTMSQLAFNATTPALQLLYEAKIPLLLIKGAARTAVDSAAQRTRAQHDVDVFVPAEMFETAARLLLEAGWVPGLNDSPHRTLARARYARALGFVKRPWGNIDLHRTPYHDRQIHPELDAKIFESAIGTQFFGIPVFVARAEERLAMSIAHGVREPESHSDWLMDAHSIISTEPIDWQIAREIFVRRKMVSQAEIALSYLRDGLRTSLSPAGDTVLSELREQREFGHLARLFFARAPDPKTAPLFERQARTLMLVLQRRWLQAAAYREAKLRGRSTTAAAAPHPHLGVTFARRYSPPVATGQYYPAVLFEAPKGHGKTLFRADIAFRSEGERLRVGFELNSPDSHLAYFHVFVLWRSHDELFVRLQAKVDLAGTTAPLKLAAQPKILLPTHASDRREERFGDVPFRVVHANMPVRPTSML